jgi:hypothetical protein
LFRPNTGDLIGAIRLLDEGNNTRIVFVTKPFPGSEGPDKFSEFFQRIRDYFADSVVAEGDAWKPTGWGRVDRTISKIRQALFAAQDEEDFQTIGLLCREAMISLAQAVYAPELHGAVDDVTPSETDAKRMLESYIAVELPGSSNEELRKYARDCVKLAASLQHMRNATYKEAALCVEASRSVANIVTIIAEQKDAAKSE